MITSSCKSVQLKICPVGGKSQTLVNVKIQVQVLNASKAQKSVRSKRKKMNTMLDTETVVLPNPPFLSLDEWV